jgi:tRNA uridine 5-carboxymethylaminomethyl modification enzyme
LWIRPDTIVGQSIAGLLQQPLAREYRAEELLRRPNLHYEDLMALNELGPALTDPKAREQVEIQIKYAGYIARQTDEIARHSRNEHSKIPINFDYAKIDSLSAEVKQKLQGARPLTVGMASRIPGVTPAAISLLLVALKKSKAPV